MIARLVQARHFDSWQCRRQISIITSPVACLSDNSMANGTAISSISSELSCYRINYEVDHER